MKPVTVVTNPDTKQDSVNYTENVNHQKFSQKIINLIKIKVKFWAQFVFTVHDSSNPSLSIPRGMYLRERGERVGPPAPAFSIAYISATSGWILFKFST